MMYEAEVECVACHLDEDDQVIRANKNSCIECHDEDYGDMLSEWQSTVRSLVQSVYKLSNSKKRLQLTKEDRTKIRDGSNKDRLLTVNTSGEASVTDASMITIGNSLITINTDIQSSNNGSYTQLVSIDIAVESIDTKMTNKAQMTNITDGIDDLIINSSGEATVKDNIR